MQPAPGGRGEVVCMTAKPLIAAHQLLDRPNTRASATARATETTACVAKPARSAEGIHAASSRPSCWV